MRHNIRTLILFLTVTAACFGQRSYTASPIGPFGFAIADLNWISDDGKTGFGAGLQVSPFAVECFAYQNGAITPIPTPGFSNCQIQGANAGTFVAVLGSNTTLIGSPLVSYTGGTFNVLTPPSGGSLNLAYPGTGVNKQGQIAATFNCPAPSGYTDGAAIPCAYVISSGGAFTRLSDLGGFAGAASINDSGDVAGWVSPAGTTAPTTTYQAVVWSHTGDRINLSNLTNLQLGYPVAISSKGQVVGAKGYAPTATSFFYDGLGTFTPIQVTGAAGVTVASLNNNGEAVGSYRSQAGDGLNHPCYYANGVALDLNAAVTNLPSGLILEGATYINNSGQILVTAVWASQPVGVIANGTAATQYLLTPVGGSAAAPAIASVMNGASFVPGSSSSTWITIQGANLSTTTRPWASSDFVGNDLPISLDGVFVTVNGLAAYPSYISPNQLNVLAPDDSTTGSIQVQVTNSQGTSKSFTVTKSDPMPAFFTIGTNYAVATHANNTLVGAPGLVSGATFTPAAPGETIQLFGTGFGAVPSAPAGKLLAQAVSLTNPVTVTIGGITANVAYAGLTSNGLDQLNITIPAGLADGDAPIVASVNGVSTQTGLLVTIKN